MTAPVFDPVILKTLGTVLILVALNVLLGIVLSFKAGNFDVRQLPRFLQTDILPILAPLVLLAAAISVYPDLKAVFAASAAFVIAKYLAEVKDKVTQLLGVKFEVNLFKRKAPATMAGPALMCFGSALAALKEGKKVARAGWNGKGMYIRIVTAFGSVDGYSMQPYVGMKTAQGTFVPWLASQTDLLAEDWFVVT